MFESLFNFDTDPFEQFRRLESEVGQLHGHSPWPAGIRAVQRGTFPPINVGATPERIDVTCSLLDWIRRALTCPSSRIC